jgi:hypothetical protein
MVAKTAYPQVIVSEAIHNPGLIAIGIKANAHSRYHG